jgi:plastocyanin
MRGVLKGVLALALGVAVAALPAVAGSETAPTIEATNYGGGGIYKETHEWSPPTATVGVSGVVTFVNNSSSVEHGVVWSSAIKPACEGVPENRGATSWRGTCTFAQPGTYTFYCYVHPSEMKGSITVNANGTTTTTMTSGGTTTTSTTTTGSSTSQAPPPGTSLLQGSTQQALTLVKSQRGTAVRGSVRISPAGAGGRLEIDLLAKRASLASASGPFRFGVGKLVRRALAAGKVSFSVPLNANGRRALRRHGHIALKAVVAVSSPAAATFRTSRSVLLRRR